MKRGTKARTPKQSPRDPATEDREDIGTAEETSTRQPGIGPRLSGGDVDADWRRADAVGEEAVGGSVATPDQDVVDEIGRALGVEQACDAEVTTSGEILRRRDRFRWHLERDADAREREEEERDE